MERAVRIPVWYYGAVMMVNAMLLTGVGILLPRLEAEYNLSLSQQGLLIGGQFVGYTVAVLTGAVLADRFGKLRALRAGMACFALTALLYGTVRAPWLLYVIPVLVGAFGGVLENLLTAIVYLDSEQAVKKSTWLQFAYCLGAVAMPVLLYCLDMAGFGWRSLVLLVGGLMALLLFFGAGQQIPSGEEGMCFLAVAGEFTRLAKSGSGLAALLAMLLYVSAEVGLWGFLPSYVGKTGGSESYVALSTSLLWAGMALSRMVVAGRKTASGWRVLVLFVSASIVSAAAVLLTGGVWLLPAAALAGFAMGPIYSYLIDWVCATARSDSASVIAAAMAVGTLGPVITGPVTGWLGERLGQRGVMLVPLVACLLIFILLLARKADFEGKK